MSAALMLDDYAAAVMSAAGMLSDCAADIFEKIFWACQLLENVW
jgi:hypothetical protein